MSNRRIQVTHQELVKWLNLPENARLSISLPLGSPQAGEEDIIMNVYWDEIKINGEVFNPCGLGK